jgi:hypothetical protein
VTPDAIPSGASQSFGFRSIAHCMPTGEVASYAAIIERIRRTGSIAKPVC